MPWTDVAPTVLTTLGAIAVGWLTARSAMRAASTRARVDHEMSSGQLALALAQENRAEQHELKQRISDLRVAWRAHRKWDEALLEELESIDPGASDRLPEPPELAFD